MEPDAEDLNAKVEGRKPWLRPPIFGLVQRRNPQSKQAPAAQVFLEVTANVRTATIKPIVTDRVLPGAEVFTDEYCIYKFVSGSGYKHGAKEYARRDRDEVCVHCNTIEGIWSGLHNFLDRFRGISQRFLHLRVRWTYLNLRSPYF